MASFALAAGMLAVPLIAEQAPVSREELARTRSQVQTMFTRMDHDKNGTISRAEYGGTPAAFDRFDLNYDGVLTPAEVEQAKVQPTTREDRLQKQDADGDGVISRKEFSGDDAAFQRLDRNQDGVLSDADKHRTRPAAGTDGTARFNAMDVNRDGQLTRDEWRGTDHTFSLKDANTDGVITLDELSKSDQ